MPRLLSWTARVFTSAALSTFIATGCATGSSNSINHETQSVRVESAGQTNVIQSSPTDAIVNYLVPNTLDDALAALVRVYTDLGVNRPALIDTTAGTRTFGVKNAIFTHKMGNSRLSKYLDCGTGAMGINPADSYQVTLSVYSTLAPTSDPSHQLLRTYVLATAQDVGGSSPAVRCASTNTFETAVATAMKGTEVTH